MYTPCDFLTKLFNRRIVDEILRNISKWGKRNLISRRFHAKDDKEAIATWRLDLNRILHVFNVRFSASVQLLLTFRFQTELGINTHVTVPDIHKDAVNTCTVVSDVHRDTSNVPGVHCDVSNTIPIVSEVWGSIPENPIVVSDIHRNRLKNCEDAGSPNQTVSAARTPTATEYPLTTS